MPRLTSIYAEDSFPINDLINLSKRGLNHDSCPSLLHHCDLRVVVHRQPGQSCHMGNYLVLAVSRKSEI